MTAAVDRARELIANAPSLVVLTGAGVSAESGVPTFRGGEGLWRTYRPEELATPQAFSMDQLVRAQVLRGDSGSARHVARQGSQGPGRITANVGIQLPDDYTRCSSSSGAWTVRPRPCSSCSAVVSAPASCRRPTRSASASRAWSLSWRGMGSPARWHDR